MSPVTKAQAKEKLAHFTVKIAYPDKWRDYSKLTMGENIGDLGGLSMAYTAYHLSLDGKPAPVIGGLTGDQRFFLAWAQVWKSKYRDEALVNLIKSNPHSPAMYRINGPLRNIDAWYTAFGVKPGDKLYVAPEDRVRIW
jgi:predicted metalloendopeptidase